MFLFSSGQFCFIWSVSSKQGYLETLRAGLHPLRIETNSEIHQISIPGGYIPKHAGLLVRYCVWLIRFVFVNVLFRCVSLQHSWPAVRFKSMDILCFVRQMLLTMTDITILCINDIAQPWFQAALPQTHWVTSLYYFVTVRKMWSVASAQMREYKENIS